MQSTFPEAAHVFADQVAAIPGDAWTGPGLGGWNLRDLVGHASRSLVTVETYLGRPADAEDLPTPEAYYAAIAGILRADSNEAAILERGRAAGRALGDHPVTSVAQLVRRVLPLLDRDDDPLVTTIAGGMRLSQYLPTRTFELVVHGLDIAAALGVEPPQWTGEVLAEVVTHAARAAVLEGSAHDLIQILTGRGRSVVGFSVL